MSTTVKTNAREVSLAVVTNRTTKRSEDIRARDCFNNSLRLIMAHSNGAAPSYVGLRALQLHV
jgi:hypothetical protein